MPTIVSIVCTTGIFTSLLPARALLYYPVDKRRFEQSMAVVVHANHLRWRICPVIRPRVIAVLNIVCISRHRGKRCEGHCPGWTRWGLGNIPLSIDASHV